MILDGEESKFEHTMIDPRFPGVHEIGRELAKTVWVTMMKVEIGVLHFPLELTWKGPVMWLLCDTAKPSVIISGRVRYDMFHLMHLSLTYTGNFSLRWTFRLRNLGKAPTRSQA